MVKVASRVARVFVEQPHRVAAAWRRLRKAQQGERPGVLPLLDELVEPFVREVGRALMGVTGSPWSRTRGLLRISSDRGARALFDEFSALRRCLNDAVDALEGTVDERRQISWAVDEAVDSAVAISQQMADPRAEGPLVPFGGVVIEVFEPASQRRLREVVPQPVSLH